MTLFVLRARDDLLAVRFAVSPVWETQAAVQAFADERGRSYHEPWLLVARARAARLDLAPVLDVLPRRGCPRLGCSTYSRSQPDRGTASAVTPTVILLSPGVGTI
jgi:hypothetical protein